jgi:hypothetical protein
VTPTGKPKYPIKISYDAGTAMDRIQSCHDFHPRLPSSFTLVDGTRVFKDKNHYITFAMLPRDSESNYVITCKCNQPDLSESEAIDLINKGMKMAFENYNSQHN